MPKKPKREVNALDVAKKILVVITWGIGFLIWCLLVTLVVIAIGARPGVSSVITLLGGMTYIPMTVMFLAKYLYGDL